MYWSILDIAHGAAVPAVNEENGFVWGSGNGIVMSALAGGEE